MRQLLEKTMITKRGLPPSLAASSDEISIRTQQGSGLKEHWAKHKGKYKAAVGLAGIAATGAAKFGPRARSAATDAREATHTASVVGQNLQNARQQAQSGNVVSAVRSANAARQEVNEARQYRDTRREAAERGVQMPSRPEYQREAAQASRQQAANVNMVAKAACMATASQEKPKNRSRAVQNCTRQYGAGIFAQGTGLGRTGVQPLIVYRQMPMLGAGHGCSEMAGNGAYRTGQRGEGHGCSCH